MSHAVTRRGAALVLAAGLVGLVGCGGGRVPVAGSVSYDGKPIDNGTITFVPAGGGDLEKASTVVKDGAYKFEPDRAPNPGKYKVEVTWNRKTGKKTPNGDGGFNEETLQMVPAKYNQSTTLTADVSSSNATIDFKLDK